jgi:glycosyltransferase involved in cell wall biosynthesis
LGISTEQVHIVNNTCERSILAAKVSANEKHPITLLYLSNLIEAKGYKDYLLALLHLSRRENCPAHVHAMLCGKLTATALDSSNTSFDDEVWIRQTIETINKSRFMNVVWVPGAYGRDKAELFSSTDIFVYPSRVDCQPTVLIEAMATECAVICSGIGEIPTMLGESAVILPKVDVEEVAEAIIYLVGNDERRIELARAARKRFEQYFSREAYAAKWKGIFARLAENKLRGSSIMLDED